MKHEILESLVEDNIKLTKNQQKVIKDKEKAEEESRRKDQLRRKHYEFYKHEKEKARRFKQQAIEWQKKYTLVVNSGYRHTIDYLAKKKWWEKIIIFFKA